MPAQRWNEWARTFDNQTNALASGRRARDKAGDDMSVGTVGANRAVDQGNSTKALVGTAVGAAVGTTVAVAGMKRLSFPLPVALIAGAVIGGPIAGVSILNNTGKPSSLWQSALVGAGPLAVVGGALGAFGAGWDGGKVGVGVATGAVMFGLAGAGIGAVTHWLTKPD